MDTIEHSNLRQRLRSQLYPRETHPFRVYRQEIQRLAATATRILDVGCGHSALDLREITTDCDKVGIDRDPDLRPSDAPSVQFIRGSSDRLPLADGSFDLVICKSDLEHLENPRGSFAEISRVLTPGGHVVILTPNRWDYVSLASTLVPNRFHPWVVRVTTGRGEENTFPTRYLANSARRLRSLAQSAGLSVDRLVHLREHPHYLAFSTFTYLAGIAFEQLIQRPCASLRPWLFVTLHKPSLT